MSCRVAVLVFADASRDARSLNVCRTLAAEAEVVLWNLAPLRRSEPFEWRTIAVVPRRRMVWRWVQFVWRLVRGAWNEKADVIWAADVYCLLPAVILRWRWKAAVIYDSRELYSALATLHRRPLAQRLLAWYERVLVRYVDRVVVSGWLDAEELVRTLRLRQKPTVVLNVPFYAEPQRTRRLHERCGIPPTAPVLLYQGAVLEGRGLLRAVEVLRELPDLHLCILGSGAFASAVEQHARAVGVESRVHLLGTVPYDELLEWTAAADVGWCWIEPLSRSYELALPNKLFEYAMARVPVIASDLPAIRSVLAEHPFGVLVPTDASPQEIAAAIARVLECSQHYRSHADCAARQWCYERQQPVICQLVRSVCVRGAAHG